MLSPSEDSTLEVGSFPRAMGEDFSATTKGLSFFLLS